MQTRQLFTKLSIELSRNNHPKSYAKTIVQRWLYKRSCKISHFPIPQNFSSLEYEMLAQIKAWSTLDVLQPGWLHQFQTKDPHCKQTLLEKVKLSISFYLQTPPTKSIRVFPMTGNQYSWCQPCTLQTLLIIIPHTDNESKMCILHPYCRFSFISPCD